MKTESEPNFIRRDGIEESIPIMQSKDDVAQPTKRHWASMRLFYLFLALTAACTVFGLWLGPAYKQAGIIDRIESIGGRVFCEESLFFPDRGTESGFVRRTMGSKYIDIARMISIIDVKAESQSIYQSIASLPNLTTVILSGSNVDDETVRAISRLKNLVSIDLSLTNVTDESLQFLYNHPTLRSVNIEGTNISTEAVEDFAKRDSLVTVSNLRGFDLQFYDENSRRASFPLKLGKNYTIKIAASVPDNCTTYHQFLNARFEFVNQNGAISVGGLYLSLGKNRMWSVDRIETPLGNRLFTGTNDFRITNPCNVTLTIASYDSRRQKYVDLHVCEIPFSN